MNSIPLALARTPPPSEPPGPTAQDLWDPQLAAVLALEVAAPVGALDRVLVLGDGPLAKAAVAVARHWGAEVVSGSMPDGGFDLIVRTRAASLPPKALRPFARVLDLGPAARGPALGLPEVAANLAVTRQAVRIEPYHAHAPETLRRAARRVMELRLARVLPSPLRDAAAERHPRPAPSPASPPNPRRRLVRSAPRPDAGSDPVLRIL